MAAKVDFDPEDLKKILSALNTAERNAEAVLSGVKSAYQSADWNDSQRAKFGEMLRASDSRLKRFADDSEAMKSFLKRLISLAQQYGS